MAKALPKPTIFDGYRYIGNQVKTVWQKHGGHIMTVAGTTGLFLTGVHACRKTYKIHKELEENDKRISDAKVYLDGEGKLKRSTRLFKETAKCAVKTTRHYIPDIIAGGVSAYAVHKGWHHEHTNYQQAAAMVGVVMADFMNYRNNVISEEGAEADRKYLTTKRPKQTYIDPKKDQATKSDEKNEDAYTIQLQENDLRIWYSNETTPQVWSDSMALRKVNLDAITNKLNMQLIYGGSYTINDVRREFYGRQSDIGIGGMYGRVWDPGDPEHPERGAFVNLHYEEDEEFMSGRKEGCWIIIDVDPEPLFESMARKTQREIEESLGI